MYDGVKTRFTRYGMNDDMVATNKEASPIFPKIGHPLVGKKRNRGKAFTLTHQSLVQAHRYAIFNCGDELVDKYIKEHQNIINLRSRSNRWDRAQSHSQDFIFWFEERVKNENVPSYIMWLSKGPNPVGVRYNGYFINGYRFHTRKCDARCKTQNSGITLQALTPSFVNARDQNLIVGDVTCYGAIDKIIQIDYWGNFSVVLFRCAWFQVERDEYVLTCVDFNKLCYLDDPYVMASQVQQVFYVEDPVEVDLHYVIKKVPRDLYDLQEQNRPNIADTLWGEHVEYANDNYEVCVDEPITWAREDEPAETIDMPPHLTEVEEDVENLEEDSNIDNTEWAWTDVDA